MEGHSPFSSLVASGLLLSCHAFCTRRFFFLSTLLTDAPKLYGGISNCSCPRLANDLQWFAQTKATSYSLSMPSCQSFWALLWTQFGLTLTPSSCRRRILRCRDFTVRPGPARIHPLLLGRRARIQEKCCRGVPEHLGTKVLGHLGTLVSAPGDICLRR